MSIPVVTGSGKRGSLARQLQQGNRPENPGLATDHRAQRTTTFVPGRTMAPDAGTCSRAAPLPTISTSRPELAACSITWRTLRPMSEGTRRVAPSATTELDEAEELLAVKAAEEGAGE